MAPLAVPSLAPTILLSALRGPGIEPDARTRHVPRQDKGSAPARADSSRTGEMLRQARRSGGKPD